MSNNPDYDKARALDAFYTNDDVSIDCMHVLNGIIPINSFHTIIEPSAGNGSFLRAYDDIMLAYKNKHNDNIDNDDGIVLKAYDIQPSGSDGRIVQKDWFDVTGFDIGLDSLNDDDYVLIYGNPPFGKRSMLAKRFIMKAEDFNVDMIAFILPNIFNKYSNQRVFNDEWMLISNTRLDDYSFNINNEAYHVPSCFQIWVNSESGIMNHIHYDGNHVIDLREKKNMQSDAYIFLHRGDLNADFALNGNNGITHDLSTITNSKAEHYIKVNDGYDVTKVRNVFANLVFNHESSVSGGNYWVSQNEINKSFNDYCMQNDVNDEDLQ